MEWMQRKGVAVWRLSGYLAWPSWGKEIPRLPLLPEEARVRVRVCARARLPLVRHVHPAGMRTGWACGWGAGAHGTVEGGAQADDPRHSLLKVSALRVVSGRVCGCRDPWERSARWGAQLEEGFLTLSVGTLLSPGAGQALAP